MQQEDLVQLSVAAGRYLLLYLVGSERDESFGVYLQAEFFLDLPQAV